MRQTKAKKIQIFCMLILTIFVVQYFMLDTRLPIQEFILHDLVSQNLSCELVEQENFDFNKDGHILAVKQDGGVSGSLQYRPYLNCLDQEDPRLENVIKDNYIHLPNKDPVNLYIYDEKTGYTPEAKDIIELVYKDARNVPKNGFFLESGSVDAESLSISLEFEMNHGWNGVLIEANPTLFVEGLSRNRKAYQVNSCLGLEKHPHYGTYDFVSSVREDVKAMGGLATSTNQGTVEMQCLPIYSIIKAIGNPTINLLILDVEGAEYHIIKTIPWDKVDIEVLFVETDLIGKAIPGGSQAELRSYLEFRGYKRFSHRGIRNPLTGLEQNDIFVREDIVEKYGVTGYSQ